jgi:AraC-like DNA-binding protein
MDEGLSWGGGAKERSENKLAAFVGLSAFCQLMPLKRQIDSRFQKTGDALNVPSPARPLLGRAVDYQTEMLIDWHHHDCGQVLYAARGAIRVELPDARWLVPPQRAAWIPPGWSHRVHQHPGLAFRPLYLDASLEGLPDEGCVLTVSPLLREMILTFLSRDMDYAPNSRQSRLALALIDELRSRPRVKLELALPAERRLERIARVLLEEPADARSLAEWAREVGASQRTLERLFRAETGLTFREWRQRLRLQAALSRLASGEPVTSVAYAVGYDSPSAFIAMFGKAMGETPGQFVARQAKSA